MVSRTIMTGTTINKNVVAVPHSKNHTPTSTQPGTAIHHGLRLQRRPI
jgi:hypothetical protein